MDQQNNIKKLWKIRFNPSGDERELAINSGQKSRFQYGMQSWNKLIAGQGKSGKMVFARFIGSGIELLSIIGADEFSQLIELSWPEEITRETAPGFVCPCGKDTDVLYWHPRLNAWLCSVPHKNCKIKVFKPTVRGRKLIAMMGG